MRTIARLRAELASYFAQRFPLRSQGVAISSTFVCSYALYGRIGGWPLLDRAELPGLLSFFFVILTVRLVDDLVNLPIDYPGQDQRVRGSALGLGLAAAVATVVALNATRPVALVLGLSVATLLSFTGFVVKRFITERPLVIAPLVEAGPALALLHSYFYWRSGHAALPPLAILSTVGLFWTYYEIWNFARRLSAAALPYELTQDRLRVLLVTLLALAVGFTVSVARAAHLSTWFVVYSALLAAGFAVWMLLPSAVAAPEARPPAYDAAPRLAAGTPLEWRPVRDRDALPSTGLILVAALQVAVAVELIWPFVVS